MSLELAAKHLASRGRNGDTELVHMTKGEVAGLQALAKAHGGKLTINPETGLPEAFFLAALLPTLFGAGAATAGAGALGGLFGSKLGIAALGAGLGALTNRRNPLMGALMGGIGAFGGAGLAQGLIGAGAAGAGAAGAAGAGAAGAGAAGAAGAGAAGAAAPMALTGVGGTSMGTAAANALGGISGVGGAPLGSTLAGLQTGVVPAATSGGLGLTSGAGLGLQAGSQLGVTGGTLSNTLGGTLGNAVGAGMQPMAAMSPTALTSGANYALTPQALSPITPSPEMLTPMQRVRLLGQGVRALGTSKGRDAFLGQAATKDQEATGVGGTSGLLKTGLAAAAPLMMAQPTTSSSAPAGSGPNPYEYTYDTNTGQYTRVSPGTRDAMPATPPMFYADGGPVQSMSDRNEALTLMANGGQQFAAGGVTGSGSLDLHIPIDLGGGQSAAGFRSSASGYEAIGAGPQQRFNGFNNDIGGGFGSANNPFMAAPAPLGQNPNQPILTRPANAPFSSTTSADMMSSRSPEDVGKAFSLMRNVLGGQPLAAADGGLMGLAAGGGVSHLGDYSDGGRLLKGPGDGVSDSIPATIADKRPARLADGEFVVPARIVSELGNGSTEAGARKLYAMMDRVQKARNKTTGKNRVAVDSRAEKALPA